VPDCGVKLRFHLRKLEPQAVDVLLGELHSKRLGLLSPEHDASATVGARDHFRALNDERADVNGLTQV
jgi:hypothetical protein